MRYPLQVLATVMALMATLLSAPTARGADPAKPSGTFPAFEVHVIDAIGSQLGQTALADIDHDGDLDYICGEAFRANSAKQPGRVWWWEYQGPDKWVRHELGRGQTDVGGAPFDVNGDGWLDFLAGSILLINPGDPRHKPFTPFNVKTVPSHDTAFADINGDGKMDAFANYDKAGLFWYEIPADPTQPWTSHTIATKDEHKIHGGTWPKAAGDLDGDGDTDIATAQAWYENVDGKGLNWRRHMDFDLAEKDIYGIAARTWVIDLEGDGDLDVIQTQADYRDGRVAWFENDGKGHFTRHIIRDKGRKEDFHSLVVADLDMDGDLDLFAGAGPLSAKGVPKKSYVWENTAGAGKNPGATKWAEHVVLEGRECHDPVCGDVDGDGDIDIIFKPWEDGNEHIYLRNMLMENRKH